MHNQASTPCAQQESEEDELSPTDEEHVWTIIPNDQDFILETPRPDQNIIASFNLVADKIEDKMVLNGESWFYIGLQYRRALQK